MMWGVVFAACLVSINVDGVGVSVSGCVGAGGGGGGCMCACKHAYVCIVHIAQLSMSVKFWLMWGFCFLLSFCFISC